MKLATWALLWLTLAAVAFYLGYLIAIWLWLNVP